MGLSGAFLTADIFNLFVFFEILLAASYGLLLHGSGQPRVRASLHYVAVNLAASSLFLIGVSMIYGVTGTLNMAELAARLSGASVGNRHLIDAGASLLAVAFLIKAGAWPLNFWLVPAYSAATPPVAALFAVLTKVGVYALVRMWTLMFAGGPLAGFGAGGLLTFGLITAALAALGMLASHRVAAQVSWGVDCVRGQPAGRAGARRRTRSRRCTVLPDGLGPGFQRLLPARWISSNGGKRARRWSTTLPSSVPRWRPTTSTWTMRRRRSSGDRSPRPSRCWASLISPARF